MARRLLVACSITYGMPQGLVGKSQIVAKVGFVVGTVNYLSTSSDVSLYLGVPRN